MRQLSNRSIHHRKQIPLSSLQSWSCRIVAHSWRQVSDIHRDSFSDLLWRSCFQSLGRKICKLTRPNFVSYASSQPFWGLIIFSCLLPDSSTMEPKICTTKVVRAGISTGKNRVENFMRNLSQKTYLGWEQTFLGFKHVV